MVLISSIKRGNHLKTLLVMSLFRHLKVNGYEVEKEESHSGASWDWKLGFEDTWVIRKRIEASNTNGQWVSLFLETDLVKKHVLTNCKQKYIEDFITKYGVQVVVWDFDTKFEHKLIFK